MIFGVLVKNQIKIIQFNRKIENTKKGATLQSIVKPLTQLQNLDSVIG